MLNITNLKETVESIITNSALTHEQAMIALSDVPLSYVEFSKLQMSLENCVRRDVCAEWQKEMSHINRDIFFRIMKN